MTYYPTLQQVAWGFRLMRAKAETRLADEMRKAIAAQTAHQADVGRLAYLQRRRGDLDAKTTALRNEVRDLSNRLSDRRRERAAAEQLRRETIAREEDYRQPGNAVGLFERYRNGDALRRELIDDGIRRLFPDDEAERGAPDFSQLPLETRLATLGLFLGIRYGREDYPRMLLGHSDHAARSYVFRFYGGPANRAAFTARLADIQSYLNIGQHLEWTVKQLDANHIVLSGHPPLPAPLLLDPQWLVPGKLLLGVDPITRERVYQPIASCTHALIAGAAGFGKSTALHVLLASVFASLDHCAEVHLVDGKDGVAMERYRDRDAKVQIIWEQDEFAALVDHLAGLMIARNIAQRRQGIDNATTDFVFVVIDELATFLQPPFTTDKAVKERHRQMVNQLLAIARRGRSVGIRLIIAVQEPTEDGIPTPIRNNLSTLLAFCLPILQHATGVFADLARLPADPRSLPVGRAIFLNRITGAQRLVQWPVISPAAAHVEPEQT